MAMRSVKRLPEANMPATPLSVQKAEAFELPGARQVTASLDSVPSLAEAMRADPGHPWRSVLDPDLVNEGREDEKEMIKWREQ